jgi:serine/threonine-protein kinase
MIGQTISHYKILKKLGEGGMGVVYEAEDTKLRRMVALKFLPPELTRDADAKRRFVQEARAASSLDHPNIAVVHDIDETPDGKSFICMTYYEGETVKQRLEKGRLSVQEAINIAIQVAEGLRRASEAGIVHRDIKPANLIITSRGEVKIVDFGIAKLAGQTKATRSAPTAGTAAYMAPEQILGQEADHRSDLFSLGVVLYEMITGRRPFQGEHEPALFYAIAHTIPSLPSTVVSDIPAEINQIIFKLLEKDPSRRYQNAGELVSDLDGFMRTGTARRFSLSFSFMRPWRYWLAAGLVAALLFYLVYPDDNGRTGKLPDVAVLPFINIDQDPFGQAFCDGLVEILTSKLTELQRFQRSISVIPAAEIRSRKITTPSEAYRDLGASLVITGSYQRIAERVRLTLTITDAVELRQRQSVVIDDPLSNAASFQDGIVVKLASMLDVELRPQTVRLLASDSTTNPRAYTLFVEAKGFMQRAARTGQLDTAITLFKRALEEDPYYTDCYTGIAAAFDALGDREKAESFQQEAVRMRPDSWHAYNELGVFYYRRSRFDDALRFFRRAIEINPNNIRGYNNLGGILLHLGRNQEAREMFERSMGILPNYVALSNLGYLFFYQRSYGEAASMYEGALVINDRDYRVWGSLAAAQYWSIDQRPKSLETYSKAAHLAERQRMLKPQDAELLSHLADFYSMLMRKDTALTLIQHALAIPPANAEIMTRGAEVYEQLGMRDHALEWIDKAIASGRPIFFIERSPGLAELQKDERYQTLSRKK